MPSTKRKRLLVLVSLIGAAMLCGYLAWVVPAHKCVERGGRWFPGGGCVVHDTSISRSDLTPPELVASALLASLAAVVIAFLLLPDPGRWVLSMLSVQGVFVTAIAIASFGFELKSTGAGSGLAGSLYFVAGWGFLPLGMLASVGAVVLAVLNRKPWWLAVPVAAVLFAMLGILSMLHCCFILRGI